MLTTEPVVPTTPISDKGRAVCPEKPPEPKPKPSVCGGLRTSRPYPCYPSQYKIRPQLSQVVISAPFLTSTSTAAETLMWQP